MDKKNKIYTLDDLKNKKFSLVFSGGSAFGFAHLGVIKYLEENGLVPDEVIGTSMGALVGSLYALGFSYKELRGFLEELNLMKLVSLKFGKGGFKNEKLYKYLKGVFGNKNMSECKINMKVIATNFQDGLPRVFCKDDHEMLLHAIMASISIPGIFDPFKIGNDYYVDGFVSSNLGIEFANNGNIILAVDVENPKNIVDFRLKKKYYFRKFKRVVGVLNSTFILMIANQTRAKINSVKNLILIEPCLMGFRRSDFRKWSEICEIGYKEVKKCFG